MGAEEDGERCASVFCELREAVPPFLLPCSLGARPASSSTQPAAAESHDGEARAGLGPFFCKRQRLRLSLQAVLKKLHILPLKEADKKIKGRWSEHHHLLLRISHLQAFCVNSTHVVSLRPSANGISCRDVAPAAKYESHGVLWGLGESGSYKKEAPVWL